MSLRDEARQDHVIGLVSQINHILAGEQMDEAQTALTLAVVCQIVCCTDDKKKLVRLAHGFAGQLDELIKRDDIVEWIKYSTTHFTGTERKQ